MKLLPFVVILIGASLQAILQYKYKVEQPNIHYIIGYLFGTIALTIGNKVYDL